MGLLKKDTVPPKHKWLQQLAAEEAADDAIVAKAEEARVVAIQTKENHTKAQLASFVTAKCLYDCSGRGRCDEDTGKCACFKGAAGLGCEVNLRCPADCSGHGTCKEFQHTEPIEYKGSEFHGECVCEDMWTGIDCTSIEHGHVQR